MENELEKLRLYLAALPTDSVQKRTDIEPLLAGCWDELTGDDGAMQGYKLLKRTEEMDWTSPELTFRIVRHGAAARGSAWGEVQHWAINVDAGTKTVTVVGKRAVRKLQPALKVEPIAEQVVALIVAGQKHSCLKWYEDGKVRIIVGNLIPSDGIAMQTLRGRRKRFNLAVETRLKEFHWKKVGVQQYQKDEQPPEATGT